MKRKRDYPRIGMGYDVHKLEKGRKLLLGGVDIPYEKGLLGHSDADVLCHAIMDSLAGAANLGDIGELFPDNRKCYEGISSLTLLKKVAAMCKERGYEIGNIDTVIIAQSPKLNSFKSAMAENLANVLSLPADSINIKATTTENLGFEGRKEGIAAQAVAILLPKYEGNEDI